MTPKHLIEMTTKQRAAIAAEMATMKHGSNQHKQKVEPSNDGSNQISVAQAAELMGVSTASVERAKKTMREDPEAHEAAKRGEKVKTALISISKKWKGQMTHPTKCRFHRRLS